MKAQENWPWLAVLAAVALAVPAVCAAPVQQAYLKASNTGSGDQFGQAMALSGDTLVIGAPYEDSSVGGVNGAGADNGAGNSGAAYVFVRVGTNWVQQAYLKASNPGSNDEFGSQVAVSGDTIVVGAYRESSIAAGVNGNQSDNSAQNAGAAYVFVRQGTNWSQQAYLKASNTAALDYFGTFVAVWGDTVVVGATGEDSGAAGVNGNQNDNSLSASGAAYVFVRNGTNWTQQAYLKASNPWLSDGFGTVAIWSNTIVVGAAVQANFGGAAYIFVRNGTTWTQQAFLKASNAEADLVNGADFFGSSVAVSGDTAVIAAYSEDSNATGVNGNQTNNLAGDSGAVYVFRRSGTTWSQEAYLKASNTGNRDSFGRSIGVSGNTVVVGAQWEDSYAMGLNDNQADNSAENSGAVYVFTRTGTNWAQQACLKASNTWPYDYFGISLAVWEDSLVVGAYQEDSSATGVNGDQTSNGIVNSGAAYAFIGVAARPQLALTRDGGGGCFIRFTGTPEATYRLLRAASLPGSWETVTTLTAPASGLVEYHDASPPPGQAFYRTAQP